MDTPDARYRAYLLRLWCMDQDGSWVWCAALQDAHSGERRTFPTLQALITFLQATCPDRPVPPAGAPPG